MHGVWRDGHEALHNLATYPPDPCSLAGRRSWLDRRSPTWLLSGFYGPLYFHGTFSSYRLSIYIYRYFRALGAIYSAVIHTARSTQPARGCIDLTREGLGVPRAGQVDHPQVA